MTSVYLARVLGAEGFGAVGFVTTLSTYVVLFSNFGIEQYSAQRIPMQGKQEREQLIVTVLVSRIMLSVIFIIPFVVFARVYAGSTETLWLFLFQCIFIAAFALNLQFFFVATRTADLLALIKIGTSMSILICSYLVISSPDDLPFVTLVNGVMTLVFFLTGAVYIFRKDRIRFVLPPFRDIIGLLKGAVPLGVSTFMIQIYYSMDIVILGFTNPGFELGLYTGAYRIILVLTAVPGLIYLAFLPDLAKITSDHYQSKVTRLYIGTVCSLGAVIAGISIVFAEQLITTILGEPYFAAVGVFRLLLANVFIVFINVSFAHLLIAWNRHTEYLAVVTTGAILNIIANIILIPRYGIYGAAIATIVAEVAVFVAAAYFHRSVFRLLAKKR